MAIFFEERKMVNTKARLWFNGKLKNYPGFDGTYLKGDFGNHVIAKRIDKNEEGVCFTSWEIADPLSPWFDALVERVTFKTTLSFMKSPRESGFYVNETATCEMMPNEDGKPHFDLVFTGLKFVDVAGLLRRIKRGKIKPRPEDSYDFPQQDSK